MKRIRSTSSGQRLHCFVSPYFHCLIDISNIAVWSRCYLISCRGGTCKDCINRAELSINLHLSPVCFLSSFHSRFSIFFLSPHLPTSNSHFFLSSFRNFNKSASGKKSGKMILKEPIGRHYENIHGDSGKKLTLFFATLWWDFTCYHFWVTVWDFFSCLASSTFSACFL